MTDSRGGRPLFPLRSMACRCGQSPEQCIPGEADLTHHAWRAGDFRNQPRERPPEPGLSIFVGHLSAEDATRLRLEATGQEPTARQLRDAAARHATALRLREAGFAVVHTPGRIRGGAHATVVWPADDPLNHQEVPWPPGVPALFDECFNG